VIADLELRGFYPQHVRNRPSRVAGEEGLQAFEVAGAAENSYLRTVKTSRWKRKSLIRALQGGRRNR
jgi:hypothetical protein